MWMCVCVSGGKVFPRITYPGNYPGKIISNWLFFQKFLNVT